MKKIKVILVDDHEIVRDGIHLVLSDAKDIKIIAETDNGEEAINLVGELTPDILLCDITMPGLSGIETAELVSRDHPDTKVIMFSMHEDEEYISKAIENKAAGYLSKNAEKEEIIAAIRTVAQGGQYFSSDVSQTMLSSYVSNAITEKEAGHGKLHLTARESEVLKYVAIGLRSKEIADKLFISTRTVETHRNNIMQKLEVKNTAELIRYSIENKLIET